MATLLEIMENLLNINKEIYCDHDQDLSLVNLCIKFETDWNAGINTENISISENDLIGENDHLKSKLQSNDKKFVVLGRTSSGKSTLINAFLQKNVLYSEFGSTSNCFVEIKGSPYKYKNYLLVNGTEKNIEELIVLNNCQSQECLENGSLITMYYNKEICQLLKNDVIIIDTPGIDSEFLTENSINNYFRDVDVIILVVNSQSGITKSEIDFLRILKTVLTNLNITIVYNFWDMISSVENYDSIKSQYMKKAEKLYEGHPNHEAESKIFFVSAKDKLNNFTNESTGWNDSKWVERNNQFDSLFSYLETKMKESELARKVSYLNGMYCQTSNNFKKCQNMIAEMRNKIIILGTKSKEVLLKLNCLNFEINSKINSEFSAIFNKGYDELIIKGLDLAKESHPLNLLQNLKELLHEIVNNCLIKSKKKINEFISHEDKAIQLMGLQIFNEIYFPLYLDLTSQLANFDMKCLERNLLEINKTINTRTGITVALTAAGVAATIATGGAAILAPRIVAGASALGATFGFGVAFKVIKVIDLPFYSAWSENNAAITALWHSFESALLDSYRRFLENMNSDFYYIISDIEEKSMKIQNNLNEIYQNLENFPNNS